MITDREFDRILGAWIAEGGERAPLSDVEAALALIVRTSQRRRPALVHVTGLRSGRHWLLAAALLVLAVFAVIGVGSGLIRLPSDQPPPRVLPALQPVRIEDWSVTLSIPEGWTEVRPALPEYRHFAGTAPEGHLSASNESPYAVTVCSPDCRTVDIPVTIPYAAEAQLQALRAGVAAVVGSSAWTRVPHGTLAHLVDGARLDTTAADDAGRLWRHVHLVGLRDRNVVAIAWSQPAEVFDQSLLDAVLGGIDLLSAPVYGDGDLLVQEDDEFAMPIPQIWSSPEQPRLDGGPVSGLRRFAEGRVLVSIGGKDGAFGWCDPGCRQVPDRTSLDALEETIREGHTLGASQAATLGGDSARMLGTDMPVERRYVVAMHGTRPVGVMIDVGDWDVAPGIIDQMIGGFRFIDPVIELPDQVVTAADGRVEVGLSADWHQDPVDDGLFRRSEYELTVRVGDQDGTIVTCDRSAGPWDQCREVQATTLEELAAAVRPAPIQDHGVGPPTPRTTNGTLDGEPSVVIRIQAYEYPARSGQEVAYVVALHDGRPYIVRVWTSRNELQGLDSIVAGFRFGE